ncbi:hypothetical protein AMJ47_03075 [Parcubacteria bacterium DG_72]|nr:MAG: hypothetical protein AMJ47_03075 [Parcubacteria bacterium DG_72]
MSKKDIIIIIVGLVILATIIIVSYFLPEKETGEGAISIVTDKKEYTLGENLKVKIANNTRDKLCFSTCYPYYIEKKDEEWTSYKYKECPEQDMVDSCVEAKDVKAFELTIPAVEKGLHRLMIQACVGCKANELFIKEKELFSNPFTIK